MNRHVDGTALLIEAHADVLLLHWAYEAGAGQLRQSLFELGHIEWLTLPQQNAAPVVAVAEAPLGAELEPPDDVGLCLANAKGDPDEARVRVELRAHVHCPPGASRMRSARPGQILGRVFHLLLRVGLARS